MKAMKHINSLFLIVALTSLTSSHFCKAAEQPRLISVSGQCNRSAVPDRGSITATVEVKNDDLKVASKKATEQYEKFKEAVQKLKLDDLELSTSEYSVNQIREYENKRYVNKGFKARMGLRITSSNIQKMGEVIAAASREGVQEVGSLSTFLSPDKLLREQTACLEEAAKNAHIKAEKLANALNAKVGPAYSVSENWQSGGGPIHFERERMAMADAVMAAPTIEPGKQDLSVTVQISFELK